ncbi:MAG TPA: TonB-dependent receptor [Gemmatimonadales bacterium]|nr:TonB-dependent receptor [Gemmatimonadales bacterium]
MSSVDGLRHQRLRQVAGTGALLLALTLPVDLSGQDAPGGPASLKRLSLEELLDVKVTSVSRRPELLSAAPSAIQVITGDDIRRSGAASLPEALRLATNLQVAQVNASQWVVTARGFGNVLSNKLLVLIDGRTVYTPLYAGVFWDVQNPSLEAIDRIEVISGPGGTLWGANAVNGVINIITKRADQTQGLYAEGGAGTEERGFGTLRYGGGLGKGVNGRVYAEGFSRDHTTEIAGTDARDGWHMFQGGFRVDGDAEARNQWTLQGDIYDGRPDPDGGTPVNASGGDVLGRWTRASGDASEFQLQAYFDRTFRDFNNGFTEALSTFDLDWQHRFPLGKRQEIIWGAGARLMDHRTENLELFRFDPGHKTLQLYSGFVQDAITLVPGRLRLTLGTKVEHHTYAGFEIQPSGRLAWTPSREQLVWAAGSRAVRTPSRIDRDFAILVAPDIPLLTGGPFHPEKVLAWELGWRVQPSDRVMFAVSGFYNSYRDLRSAEPTPVTTIPIVIGNGVEGNTWGVEVATQYQVVPRWRLRAGYTWFDKDLHVKDDSNDLNAGSVESNDPSHQAQLQSVLDLGRQLELDFVARYVGELEQPEVPDYVGLDVRLGWRPLPRVSVVVVGQNLLKKVHREFIADEPGRQIDRGIYAKVVWQ